MVIRGINLALAAIHVLQPQQIFPFSIPILSICWSLNQYKEDKELKIEGSQGLHPESVNLEQKKKDARLIISSKIWKLFLF